MIESEEKSKRTLSIKKIIDAPIELVWEAWTNENNIVKWWAPPGMEIEVKEHDFKVGGKWKYAMPMPNGSTFVSEGQYLEIQEFEKIVTTADFKPMTEGVELHITFEKEADTTIFTFSVLHASEAYCLAQEKMGFYNGWGSTLSRMENFILSKT